MNEKVKVSIGATVPVTVMEEPSVELRMNNIFSELKPDLEKRCEEIKSFIFEHRDDDIFKSDSFSYENIMFYFKMYFSKTIMNEATVLAFNGKGGYNILSNVIHLITAKKLKKAIYGEEMIAAFKKIMCSSSTGNILGRNGLITLLRKEFLGKKPTYIN